MPVKTDCLSLSLYLLFCLSISVYCSRRTFCSTFLQDKVLRQYPIGYDQDRQIQIYFSATSYCLDSNKCVRLTDTWETKLQTVVLSTCADEIRESSTTFGAEESASRATRRDLCYALVWKKSLPDFRRLDVAPVNVLTSYSCRRLRRLDITLLPTSWCLVPAVVFDVLTSHSCRRPDVLFLSSSSPSWRHAPADVLTYCSCRRLRRLDVRLLTMSWRIVPPADVLTSCSCHRVVILTSRSCHRLRRPGVTHRRPDVVLLACLLFMPSSLTSFCRRRSDVLSTSSRRRRVHSLLSALVTPLSFVWRIHADSWFF